jgi:hypothetical protein
MAFKVLVAQMELVQETMEIRINAFDDCELKFQDDLVE